MAASRKYPSTLNRAMRVTPNQIAAIGHQMERRFAEESAGRRHVRRHQHGVKNQEGGAHPRGANVRGNETGRQAEKSRRKKSGGDRGSEGSHRGIEHVQILRHARAERVAQAAASARTARAGD